MNEPRRFLSRNWLGAGVGLTLAFLVTAGLRSWNELETTRERERELESRIVEAERRIEGLFDHVKRLDDDPITLEREARNQLGLVHPSDVVIVLPPEPGTAEWGKSDPGLPVDGGSRATKPSP